MIILLLAALIIPAYSVLQSKAEAANCTTNLRGLYAAAHSSLQDSGQWPKITAQNIHSREYAEQWLAALSKYGVAHKNWICPSVQRFLRNPDYTKTESIRLDYFATPFGNTQASPLRHQTHPWFLERASIHGDGQLIILANGQVRSHKEISQGGGIMPDW